MGKSSLSIRLESDLVKRLDARRTKTKNRSDVISELLYSVVEQSSVKLNDLSQDQIRQQKAHAELLSKGAKAAIMALRFLELATELHSSKADEIFKKAEALYLKEVKVSEPEPELETDNIYG